ncbi:VOC family protein [Pseudonocardia sp. HH130630-07]|uniref:VOC family protein n=1 Tax=Pseudonocardia sp. HH130630-07 TaxID=1690815 RepID=UPI000814B63B|nr:VOC family protein [Pseudonocardia sp. HH130630-07]ANY06848.1 glyoxalase [Pseudonocardia sp. HH130630-07]
MTAEPAPTVWPALRYTDAPAALRFLVDVIGFREALVVPDDGGDIVHAELRWPEGGAVMLGSLRHTEGVHDEASPGTGVVYVVTDRVDDLYATVRSAGVEVTRELEDTDYGSHTFSMRDAEGNQWTFGTYRGAA